MFESWSFYWVSENLHLKMVLWPPHYPPHLPKGGGTYCFWNGSSWHKDSCPLCNLNTLWNILIVLGRNVEQDNMCRIQEWQLWLSYFGVISLCFVWNRFCVRAVTRIPFRNILMVLGRNVEQDQTTCCVQEWQLYLSYFWRYLPLLYLTVIMHWFGVRNLNTLLNILMILARNIEQDKKTCCIQEWQLWLSYFFNYFPLFCLKKILCPLCNSNTFWNILMVLGGNVGQYQTTCCIQEWQLYLSYFLCYLPLLACLLKRTGRASALPASALTKMIKLYVILRPYILTS